MKGQETQDAYDKFDYELCGHELPHYVVSDGPRLAMVFSSGELQARGFKVSISSINCQFGVASTFRTYINQIENRAPHRQCIRLKRNTKSPALLHRTDHVRSRTKVHRVKRVNLTAQGFLQNIYQVGSTSNLISLKCINVSVGHSQCIDTNCTYKFLATPNEQVTIVFDHFKVKADNANVTGGAYG